MKSILITVSTVFLFVSNILAQCPQNNETKVLLVGDSWAFFMGVDQTINKVFDDWGFPEYEFKTNLTLAENGATTNDFLSPTKQGEIANQLISNPSIDFVHLSIGGNDVLGNWKSQTFTQAQTDSLVQQVEDSIYAVIDFIKGIRPDVKIVYSGYAYPNFGEVIHDQLIPTAHPFYGTWDDMEQPTFIEINSILNKFSDDLLAHFANDPRVSFTKATGITQYTFGQIDPLSISPGGTYLPFTVSLPEGNPNYPSPKESMRDYGITKDCFHLSKKGFYDFISYTAQKFYQKALMDDKYFIAQDASVMGSVDNLGNVYSPLYLGEDGGTQYQSILTFNTLAHLDSIVEKASIFLHIENVLGANPIDQDVVVSVNNGAFGTNLAVEAVDFNDSGVQDGVPCLYGSNDKGHWVRLDLPQNMMEYITNINLTQFKITTPNALGKRVTISGVSNPDFAPVLNITYGNQSTAKNSNIMIKPYAVVFPNPSDNVLNIKIKNGYFDFAEIYTLGGSKMGRYEQNLIDVSHYAKGTYLIHIYTNDMVLHHKIIVN